MGRDFEYVGSVNAICMCVFMIVCLVSLLQVHVYECVLCVCRVVVCCVCCLLFWGGDGGVYCGICVVCCCLFVHTNCADMFLFVCFAFIIVLFIVVCLYLL